MMRSYLTRLGLAVLAVGMIVLNGGQALAASLSDTAVARVTISTTLSNSGWWWQTKTVTLPPDTNQQKISLESISPKPSNLKLDEDGNILAEYSLRPHQTVKVEASAVITVSTLHYDYSQATALSNTPEEIADRYLASSASWGDDSTINVSSIGKKSNALLQAIFKKVANGQANATEPASYSDSLSQANKLVGELRANNLPSRVVLGKQLAVGQKLLDTPVDHAWAEAYLPDVGWLTLDPTLPASSFGQTSSSLVGVAIRGLDPNFPPEQLTATSLELLDEAPANTVDSPNLTDTKYMILPGLAIENLSVSLPAGGIVDEAGFRVTAGINPLGSLAPLQTASIRQLALGAQAFSKQSVAYGQIKNDQLAQDLATTETKISYTPMLALVGLVVLSGLAYLVRLIIAYRRDRRPATPTQPEAAPAEPAPASTPTETKNGTMSLDDWRAKVRSQVKQDTAKQKRTRKPPIVQ